MISFKRLSEEGEQVILRIPEAGEALMTVDEVAEILNVNPDVLRKWAAHGVGPTFYSWAQEPFYRSVEVEAWLRKEIEAESDLKIIHGEREPADQELGV